MRQWQERRFLTALLSTEQRKPPSPLRRFVVPAMVWLASVFVLFLVFRFLGSPTNREMAWIAGGFLVGAVIGALGVFHASRDQWPILRQYIDFDRVRQRLSSLKD